MTAPLIEAVLTSFAVSCRLSGCDKSSSFGRVSVTSRACVGVGDGLPGRARGVQQFAKQRHLPFEPEEAVVGHGARARVSKR